MPPNGVSLLFNSATEEERSADLMAKVYSSVGLEIKKMEAENAELRAKRSLLKKFFDYLVYGG